MFILSERTGCKTARHRNAVIKDKSVKGLFQRVAAWCKAIKDFQSPSPLEQQPRKPFG